MGNSTEFSKRLNKDWSISQWFAMKHCILELSTDSELFTAVKSEAFNVCKSCLTGSYYTKWLQICRCCLSDCVMMILREYFGLKCLFRPIVETAAGQWSQVGCGMGCWVWLCLLHRSTPSLPHPTHSQPVNYLPVPPHIYMRTHTLSTITSTVCSSVNVFPEDRVGVFRAVIFSVEIIQLSLRGYHCCSHPFIHKHTHTTFHSRGAA